MPLRFLTAQDHRAYFQEKNYKDGKEDREYFRLNDHDLQPKIFCNHSDVVGKSHNILPVFRTDHYIRVLIYCTFSRAFAAFDTQDFYRSIF